MASSSSSLKRVRTVSSSSPSTGDAFPSNVITRLVNNDPGAIPCVLQIMEMKRLKQNRTRVVLSDGNHYMQGLLNSALTTKWIEPKLVGEWSMIVLEDYVVSVVNGIKVLIVAGMESLGDPNIQFGKPIPFVEHEEVPNEEVLIKMTVDELKHCANVLTKNRL